MPDTVLLALQNKLARYEEEGDPEKVKRVKARIAELEKGEKADAKLPMSLSPEPQAPPAVLGATVSKKSAAPKPTVQKARKATKSRKK
jgi:hypothetical protein